METFRFPEPVKPKPLPLWQPHLAGREELEPFTPEAELLEFSQPFDFEDGVSLTEAARVAYTNLFHSLEASGQKPLRLWNSFPRINQGADQNGSGTEELYKCFNKGRRQAWLQYDPSLKTVCAATGIGNSNPEAVFSLCCLATNHPVVHLENPNQISFLDYSAKYGTPPSSRRGTLHFTPSGVELYLAGTASIVGENNKYAGDHEPKDIRLQLRQTIDNIQTLISAENLERQTPDNLKPLPAFSLTEMQAVRVYLRNPADLEMVKQELEGTYGLNPEHIMYLQADICRRPLDLEIEGCFL